VNEYLFLALAHPVVMDKVVVIIWFGAAWAVMQLRRWAK